VPVVVSGVGGGGVAAPNPLSPGPSPRGGEGRRRGRPGPLRRSDGARTGRQFPPASPLPPGERSTANSGRWERGPHPHTIPSGHRPCPLRHSNHSTVPGEHRRGHEGLSDRQHHRHRPGEVRGVPQGRAAADRGPRRALSHPGRQDRGGGGHGPVPAPRGAGIPVAGGGEGVLREPGVRAGPQAPAGGVGEPSGVGGGAHSLNMQSD